MPDKAFRVFDTLFRDQEVEGSNPFAPTIILPMSQAAYTLSYRLRLQLRVPLSLPKVVQVVHQAHTGLEFT